MIVDKIITSTQETEVRIAGITLLSKEEYDANEEIVSKIDEWWWLRSPGFLQDLAVRVNPGGTLCHNYVSDDNCVRPVLIGDFKSAKLLRGDKFNLENYTWTVLTDDMALCDNFIGFSAFCNDGSSNDFEKSDIKKVIEKWAKENGIF